MKSTGKKTIGERREELAHTAKDLYSTGRETYARIKSKPVWHRLRMGLERAAGIVGRGTKKAAKKTGTLAKQAGVTYEKYEHEHKLQKLLAEFGGRIYDRVWDNPQAISSVDPDAADMVERITAMKEKTAELLHKEEDIKSAA